MPFKVNHQIADSDAFSEMSAARKSNMGKSILTMLRGKYNGLTFTCEEDGDCYVFTISNYDELDCLQLVDSVSTHISANQVPKKIPLAMVRLFTADASSSASTRLMSLRVQPINVDAYLSHKRRQLCWKIFIMLLLLLLAAAFNLTAVWKYMESSS